MKQTTSMAIMTRALFSRILLRILRTFGDNLIAMDSRAGEKQQDDTREVKTRMLMFELE